MDLFAYINKDRKYKTAIWNDKCSEMGCEAKLKTRARYLRIKADGLIKNRKMCDFIIFIRRPNREFGIPAIELKSGSIDQEDIDPILDKFENGVKLIGQIVNGSDVQLSQCDIIKQLFVNKNEIDSPSAYRTWTRRFDIRLKRCGDIIDVC